MVAALAIFALTFTPYVRDSYQRIVDRVLLYHSWGGYGFGSGPLFYVAIAVLPFLARRLGLDVLDGLLFCAVGQMVFIYGAGSNNIYPVFALGFIRPSNWLIPLGVVYVLLVAPWTALEIPVPNTNNFLWILCLGWFIWMIFVKSRTCGISLQERMNHE